MEIRRSSLLHPLVNVSFLSPPGATHPFLERWKKWASDPSAIRDHASPGSYVRPFLPRARFPRFRPSAILKDRQRASAYVRSYNKHEWFIIATRYRDKRAPRLRTPEDRAREDFVTRQNRKSSVFVKSNRIPVYDVVTRVLSLFPPPLLEFIE